MYTLGCEFHIHKSSFNLFLGFSPRLHFEQFQQRWENASLATWADGRFTQEIYWQNYFSGTTVLLLLDEYLLPRFISLIWHNYGFIDKCTGNLMVEED